MGYIGPMDMFHHKKGRVFSAQFNLIEAEKKRYWMKRFTQSLRISPSLRTPKKKPYRITGISTIYGWRIASEIDLNS